jgi:hypothetical protein
MRKDEIEERIIRIEDTLKNLEAGQREQGGLILSELRSFQRLFIEEQIETMRKQIISGHQRLILELVLGTVRREYEKVCPDPCSLYERGECIDFFISRLRETAERMDPDEVQDFLSRQIRLDEELIQKYPELGEEPCLSCLCIYTTERDQLMKAIGELASVHASVPRTGDFSSIRDLPDNEVIATIIEPLSHPVRFSMVKALSRGNMSYSQLSNLTGYKGGHLLFHITRLIEAGLIIKERSSGQYRITKSGMGCMELVRKIYTTI